MTTTYSDFVEAMHDARSDGHDVNHFVIADETFSTFLKDDNFTEEDEERHDDLGEFEVPVETGDGNYVITESGERYEV